MAVSLSRDFAFAGGCGCGALPLPSCGGALVDPGRRDVLGLSGLALGSWRRRGYGAGADRELIKVPGGIGPGRGHRLDAIDPRGLGQQFESDRGLHLEAEVPEAAQSYGIGIGPDVFHFYGLSASSNPGFMPIEI
jgi:hypothetical protein